MQNLSDLSLYYLPVESPELSANPFPEFAAAREKHPWLAASAIGYFVHEYTAMCELFVQDDKLRPSLDSTIEFLGGDRDSHLRRWMLAQILMMPREKHRRMRNLLATSFTPRHANELRTLIRTTVTRLLEEWAPRGSFDFEEFASWFPIEIMFDMLGAPLELIAECRDDLHTMGFLFSFDKSRLPELEATFQRLHTLANELLHARQANPYTGDSPDLLDTILAASANGAITHRQIVDLVISFIVAAFDSTKNNLTLIMRLLIERLDIYQRCADDFDYCSRVVEEALRYQSTATALRVTTEDVIFRGVLIPEGTMLFFPFSISGRDPGTFADAQAFDPDQTFTADRHHIAFGLGQHICIGRYIARVELQEALHQIPRRIREPKLAGEVTWRPFPGIWGPETLPTTFTPA